MNNPYNNILNNRTYLYLYTPTHPDMGCSKSKITPTSVLEEQAQQPYVEDTLTHLKTLKRLKRRTCSLPDLTNPRNMYVNGISRLLSMEYKNPLCDLWSREKTVVRRHSFPMYVGGVLGVDSYDLPEFNGIYESSRSIPSHHHK